MPQFHWETVALLLILATVGSAGLYWLLLHADLVPGILSKKQRFWLMTVDTIVALALLIAAGFMPVSH